MEERMSTTQAGVRYGLIFGVVGIIYFAILQFAGLGANQALGYVGFIFTIVGLVLAHKAFKDDGDGYMKYGQGMSISFIFLVVSSLLSTAFTWVYLSFIDDSMLQMVKDRAMEEWEAAGMSDEAIAQAESMSGWFMSATGISVMGLLGGIFMGLIIALIVTAITKNTPPENDLA